MGEIINKISFNGTAYDITIPHGTVSALQSGTNYNIVRVSSLPSIGQMIAITFPARLTTPMVIFETDEIESTVSAPMTITYKGRGISPDTVVPYSTYSFIITQDTSSNLMLELIGDFDSVLGSHASSTTSYGVGTIGNYGHVKTITGDLSSVTSHRDGYAAAAYHSHSNYVNSTQLENKLADYVKTVYLSTVNVAEESDVDNDGIVFYNISIDAGIGISHEPTNGDMFIIPLSVSNSYAPGRSYYTLSGVFTILTPSGVQSFTFSNSHLNKFNYVPSGYHLICVVENDEYLRVLNPVENVYSWEAYTATSANYASTATTANYASTATTAKYATTATQATKIATTRYIDGLAFNGSSNVCRFGVCTAVGNTAIKKVSIPGLTAITGAIARVKFDNAHTVTTTTTATRARLVLNNATYSTSYTTGVIRAFSTGLYISSTNSWAAGQIVEMIYDGTYWNIISPYIKYNNVASGTTGEATLD